MRNKYPNATLFYDQEEGWGTPIGLGIVVEVKDPPLYVAYKALVARVVQAQQDLCYKEGESEKLSLYRALKLNNLPIDPELELLNMDKQLKEKSLHELKQQLNAERQKVRQLVNKKRTAIKKQFAGYPKLDANSTDKWWDMSL